MKAARKCQEPLSLRPGFASQGVVDDFNSRLDVDKFVAFDKKVFSPGHAPHCGGNFILLKLCEDLRMVRPQGSVDINLPFLLRRLGRLLPV